MLDFAIYITDDANTMLDFAIYNITDDATAKLCDVQFTLTEGNGRKFSHIQLSISVIRNHVTACLYNIVI